jgi:hypothetical protein
MSTPHAPARGSDLATIARGPGAVNNWVSLRRVYPPSVSISAFAFSSQYVVFISRYIVADYSLCRGLFEEPPAFREPVQRRARLADLHQCPGGCDDHVRKQEDDSQRDASVGYGG